MKKKVLILVNHDLVIYNFRRELVERLVSDGYEVYLSCPQGMRIPELIEMGCKYIEAEIERHGKNIKTEISLLKYYKKIMKEIKPDVVLSYTIKPNLYGGMAAARLGIPYIANITGLGSAAGNRSFLQKAIILAYKYAFRKIKCVFVQNENIRNTFAAYKIVPDKLKLIPGSGVNLKHFTVLPYPKDTNEFYFISRIMKEKGIDQFLEAAEHYKNENIGFHVCGFCEEEYEDKLKELNERGVITYHGMVKDVRDALNNASATIHPTYYFEGISNVLLESCACGRPVITTNQNGCIEVVDEGKNGFIVNMKDTKSLIAAIDKFLKLPDSEREKMGLYGRQKVEKEFDRQIVVEKYMEQIKNL
ncbi:MAG: glycosyltransferase family 4 protein [Clostridia bacterium]|nr:glycosyltransferase family 4 protein [Clostridia bacterium]